jgi:hydrocephalus-inducing protein
MDNNADAASKTLIRRRYKNLVDTVENHPLLFSDAVFQMEPSEGVVWPHSETVVNVVFRPTAVGLHKKTIYCEIVGRETRLPLQLRVRSNCYLL